MNPVFELNDLHVSLQSHHKETELVRGVSFAVAPGECLGILGESGSGKSMSMKAAMGLLDHSFHVKGSAQFQGEELLGKSAEELRRLRGGKVGIILQNPMTCFDPLYRIGQQIAETFSAHNNWTAEEIHIRSLELLEKMRESFQLELEGADPKPGGSAGKISASAFRRYAPAHHDRHCSGHETSSSDCRRTYHGDRCHHPV